MENYRFQIERLQMNIKDNSEAQRQQIEMLQLKEKLKDKVNLSCIYADHWAPV